MNGEAIMKIFLAFTYPLAALFAMTGIPFFWWSVGISLAVHAGIVIWLKTAPRLSPKRPSASPCAWECWISCL